MRLHAVVALSLGLAVGLLANCSQEPCSPSNCSGCCDSAGACQEGRSDEACGMQGTSCEACAAPYYCAGPACLHTDGGGAGGGGGTGGGIGGGGGGTSTLPDGGACNATGLACDGTVPCCEGVCHAGVCLSGPICRVAQCGCTAGTECCSGQCAGGFCTATTCPDGGICPVEMASIHVTPSTNSAAIDVVTYDDGSAERTLGGTPFWDGGNPMARTFPAQSPEVVSFLCHLAEVGNLTTVGYPSTSISSSACPKSASFGTLTTITAGGATSGDMECVPDAGAVVLDLARDCKVLTERVSP